MKHVSVLIKGRVIGVSFRAWTKTQANFLSLTGWVKNVGNHVEAVFQSDEEKINKMLELLKLGPPSARVEDVKVIPKKDQEDFKKFEIKKD